jgi:DNA-binding ferritin-like protein (Dps family)
MALFKRSVPKEVEQQASSQVLDAKQIEAALNQVVANMKKTYDVINARLDKMQSDIEQSFVEVGEDFVAMSRDVEALKSIVSGVEDFGEEPAKPKKMYKRVTANEVKDFESERLKKKALKR